MLFSNGKDSHLSYSIPGDEMHTIKCIPAPAHLQVLDWLLPQGTGTCQGHASAQEPSHAPQHLSSSIPRHGHLSSRGLWGNFKGWKMEFFECLSTRHCCGRNEKAENVQLQGTHSPSAEHAGIQSQALPFPGVNTILTLHFPGNSRYYAKTSYILQNMHPHTK